MTGSILGFAAIAAYMIGLVYHLMQLRKDPHFNPISLQTITGIGICLHGLAIAGLLLVESGLDLSLFKILALLALVINVLVFVSGLKKPLHSLYLALLPLSALCLLAALVSPSSKPPALMSGPMQAHVLISILAYSLLAIAALQALLAGYQDWQLKHKHQNLLMRTFPPLQSMEALLFELIWAGELILTLSLLSGFFFYEDFFAQKLLHKVVFSLVAWVFFGVLLWGRQVQGWRGKTAIRWTWAGFIAIVLGYVGSKVVLEFLLV